METVAARSKLHNWSIRPHRHHDLHQLLLIHRKRFSAKLDKASVALDPPAFVAVPPEVVHSFTFEPGTVGMVISFALQLIGQLAAPGIGIAEFLDRPMAQALAARAVRETDLKPPRAHDAAGVRTLRPGTPIGPARAARRSAGQRAAARA